MRAIVAASLIEAIRVVSSCTRLHYNTKAPRLSVSLIKATLLVAGLLAFGIFLLEHFTDRIDTEHTVWILQTIPFVAMGVILLLILAQRSSGPRY